QRSNLLVQGLVKENSKSGNYLGHFNSIISESDIEGYLTGNTIILRSGGKDISSGGLLWKTKLSAPAMLEPQIVININTGDKEIFTQDTAGNIYLISKSGEILFTKNIPDKIISEVYQVDYYHNEKLQYIFNTAGHVYIVDRLGNFVASYPLRISGTASAGLTVVHDETMNTDHYYIPSASGSVYGYELTGKPLPGWSPKGGTGVIEKPLQYNGIGKSFMILALNKMGKLMAMDGKGVLKWSVENLPVTSQNLALIRQGNDFVLLDVAVNQLTEIASDGNDKIRRLVDTAGSFSATAISDSAFLYSFATTDAVRTYNNQGQFKGAISFTSPISQIEVIDMGGIKYLQVTSAFAKKVILFDVSKKLQISKSEEADHDAEFAISNPLYFKITNLLGGTGVISIVADGEGGISCYRLK
ncbi:MAG: repeat protein, partial [Bacteroidota bacterium]|nr:repeat protein [Bacteroidota bacterium]